MPNNLSPYHAKRNLKNTSEPVLPALANKRDSSSRATKANVTTHSNKPKTTTDDKPLKNKSTKKGVTSLREEKLPELLSPQLATLVDTIPESDDWIYEVKFDGYRLLARIDRGKVKLFTRNGTIGLVSYRSK